MMTEEKIEVNPAVMQEVGILNVRINDLMVQLNKVLSAYHAEIQRLSVEKGERTK